MVLQKIFGPDFQPYDIPLIGDDLANIGRIVDIYSQPCNATPLLWVKGFFQAIPTLIWSAFKPEVWDIDIRSRHRRRKKPKNLLFRAFDAIPDALITIPVPRWLPFVIHEAAERVGWYFLIADALEDFTVNWMSTVYQWNGCTLPGVAHATMRPPNALQNFMMPPGGAGVFNNWLTVGDKQEFITFNDGMWIGDPGKYRFSAQFTARPHPSVTPRGSVESIELIDLNTFGPLATGISGRLANLFNVAGVTAQVRITTPSIIEAGVLLRGTPGWIQIDRASTVLSGDGEVTDSLGPDP